MAAPLVLLGVAFALAALALAARSVPGLRRLQPALCLLGLAAALLSPDGMAASPWPSPSFAVDGLARPVLAALFLLGACGAAGPGVVAALTLAALAGDAISLLAAVAAASLSCPGWRRRAVPVLALATALLLLAWHGGSADPGFAAIRAAPPEGVRGALLLAATLLAAATLPNALPGIPGPLTSFLLLGRLLLDLPGPSTPGWWGVPVLAGAMAGAVVMARRAAAADDLAAAAECAARATLSLAAAALAAALLARGADLAQFAGLAVEAALLMVCATALWGGLLLLAAAVIQASAGTTSFARLGGLLRRVPVTGNALLIALLSMGSVPLSLGFAPVWLLVQTLLGVGRLGGTALLALAAASAATLGLTGALLAAAALRMAGSTLLASPRSAKAATMAEPPLRVRIGMGVLAGAVLLAGFCPSLVVLAVQPAVRQLAGAAAEGAGPLLLSASADTPGYAPAILAGLLLAAATAAAYACRGATVTAPAWRGGLAEDGPACASTQKLVLWPRWRPGAQAWRAALAGRGTSPAGLLLGALALALAAALGWAAR